MDRIRNLSTLGVMIERRPRIGLDCLFIPWPRFRGGGRFPLTLNLCARQRIQVAVLKGSNGIGFLTRISQLMNRWIGKSGFFGVRTRFTGISPPAIAFAFVEDATAFRTYQNCRKAKKRGFVFVIGRRLVISLGCRPQPYPKMQTPEKNKRTTQK